MQNIRERKPLLIKIVAVILLIILCCNLPEEILFWKLCMEQDRNIPPNTEVIVSACKRPRAIGVPGGEVLFVQEGRSGKMYLLDLHTGKKRKVPNDPLLPNKGIFLSSELVWLEGSPGGKTNPSYRPHYILDLTNGKRYELTDISGWIDEPAPPDYVPYFQSAEQVFIHHGNNMAIALPPDFQQNPYKGVILYKHQLNTETDFNNGELLEIIMKDLGVNYKYVDYSLQYAGIPSPTEKYFARTGGIYTNGIELPVAEDLFLMYYFAGWYYDESGIVYNTSGYCYIGFMTSCFYRAPGNVLKLNLPTP